MSKTIKNPLIQDFLNEVERRLPAWLREHPNEFQDVLDELEEHIWDIASDLSPGEQPGDNEIRQAIVKMGSPMQIAKEYKKRGTPYVYITEEWWSYYTKVLKIIFLVILSINVLIFGFSIGSKPIWDLTADLFGGLWASIIPGILIISVIFVAISMQGFLPEDFGLSIQETGKIEFDEKIIEEWEKHKQDSAHLERRYNRKERISREKRIERHAQKHHHIHHPINIKDYLAGGIFGLLFGFYFMIQPNPEVNQYFHPEFLIFLRYAGALSIINGVIQITQALVGRDRITAQQILLALTAIMTLIFIPIWLDLAAQPEIIPFLGSSSASTLSIVSTIIKIFIYLSVFGSVVNLIKVFFLRERVKKYYSRLESINESQEKIHIIQ